ncbi:spirocyclase AveC family protein [Mycobacterium sp. M23085]|uniref:spirocyclase AveC family protein n=1 Tax=Mycobacterium sp. M23085 TaxID=3378087 RepID=UPI003877B655
MSSQMTPVMQAASDFALIGGIGFTVLGIYLSVRQHRLHPLLLLCISAVSFSWIEAPYDWAMYAQFPPAIPRMPSWWPLNVTWGGLPSFVPVGYISYFVLPAVTGTALGRWLSTCFGWRRPQTLLVVGLIVGFCWALFFNGFLGAKLGVFYYGRVITGLAIREGTVHQYPLYDSLAMAIQMMLFTYLLGRTDVQGHNVIEMWAEKRSKSRVGSSILSVITVIVIGNVVYGAVFAPHLATKLGGWVTTAPTGELFPGVPNQPK